jgi:hypothetical protein
MAKRRVVIAGSWQCWGLLQPEFGLRTDYYCYVRKREAIEESRKLMKNY